MIFVVWLLPYLDVAFASFHALMVNLVFLCLELYVSKTFEIRNCFFSVNAVICNDGDDDDDDDNDDDDIVFSDDLIDVVTLVSPSWIYTVPP